ncbi:MAG: Electron transport complex subunit RsxC [Flavobacteriales bacterium]|nr:Electron transport complex subunit RsxC [Flavobacteriales bacterium]MCL4816454.1 NADH-quinone oxidoreductase subunit L [Flavobacteriales bacterium]WKZ73975.1 MAG: NADH-ubiquinone oxidoreductase-F iron-sulfur binding region domain-containing protein [Vicingaceae bacterium]
MSKNLSELSGRKGLTNNLFEKMGDAAKETGTPSEERLNELSEEFLIGKASTYGTTTFYDFTKPENKNKKVYICNGSACVCAGTQQKVKETLLKQFTENEIGHMTCLGRCYENSAFHYQGKNFSGQDMLHFKKENLIQNNLLNYNIKATTPLLTIPYSGFENHYALLKKALNQTPDELLSEIKKSNLRGRGGAGFPMGFKWEACKNENNNTKFIICNADEGDPGAYSDRYLLEQRPHSVLFGMMVAGYITGAEWGVLYIRAEYPEAANIVQQAIDELKANNLLGKNINHSNFNFDFKIIKAQGAYICGEETALINSIEGQRPEVRTRPPFPTQMGLFNKPTVVNNVETLAAVYSIIKNGGADYAKLGTEKSKGTKLVCLDSFFNHPGIYEVEMGTPLSFVINELGGGFKIPVKAMQIGGPLGGIVPLEKINELSIDFESFAKQGFLLGHASVVCIPTDFPMMKYLEHLFEFAAYESCGKCFPCRLGTKRGHELTQKALNENYKIDRALFADLLNTLQQGSLCAHGGGIPLPVRNALHYFNKELKMYFN